ncbi:hypothetical protein ACHQM5_007144 [Ranunculus cassubicifolius]
MAQVVPTWFLLVEMHVPMDGVELLNIGILVKVRGVKEQLTSKSSPKDLVEVMGMTHSSVDASHEATGLPKQRGLLFRSI